MVEEFAAKTSVIATQDMIDVVFDMDGSSVPEDYPFILWSEVERYLPWLKDEKDAGIHPLRGSPSGEHTLLSKRTKLILRVPAVSAEKTLELSGKQLNVGGNILSVGNGKLRQLQAATTLHAHIVESDLGEVDFLADMNKKLQAMNITCNLICDKYRKIKSVNQTLSGYGLVVHDLKPLASMQIQQVGLGGARHFGCGIFVPFKAISGLD